MSINEVKFWIVLRHDIGNQPIKRHAHRGDAITEANRLANLSGDAYYVLEVVGVVKPIQIPYDFTEI